MQLVMYRKILYKFISEQQQAYRMYVCERIF